MLLLNAVYSLTSMLIARFLLNLQETKRRLETSSRSLEEVSDISFRPYVVGDSDGFTGFLRGQLSFHHDTVPGEDADP